MATLVAAHLILVTAVLYRLGGLGSTPSLPRFVGLVAAFAIVGLAPLHLQFRRGTYTLVLTEAVLVIGFSSVDPGALVVLAAVGEAAGCLATRHGTAKVLFNVTSVAGGVAVAAVVFAATDAAGLGHTAMWTGLAAAAVAYGLVNAASVTAVLAIVERRPVRDVLDVVAPSTLLSTGASASLGLCAVLLAGRGPLAPMLLLPVVLVAYAGTRSIALRSSEQFRFERLYEASSRSGGLVAFTETLAQLAAEARGLVTGAVGVCCAERGDGRWEAMVVDDDGARPASHESMEALLSLGLEKARDVDLARLPRSVRDALPEGHDLVWAPSSPDSRSRVALAVIRELAPDGEDATRADVLAAFAGHAALAIANAVLYAEVEEALRQQLDLNQQKSDFVAAVSHELRTPLTVMTASMATVRRLRERLSVEETERLVSTALTQGDRLKRLIEELLLVASAEHGALQVGRVPVDVERVVHAVVDDMEARSRGRLRVRVAPDVGPLQTDEDKLTRILVNLVDNGLKYAPDGPVEVSVVPVDGGIRISVVDRGPGIAAADRERVFERFVQLDQSSTRRQGGTGLGLALSRDLAGLLGGTLTLADTEVGCCFVLWVPRAAGADLGTGFGTGPQVTERPLVAAG